eukprot:CAMPEP_0184984798 /NCGR_PEP_ID=MMETSP1098-20130426/13682_1 /TAXON_ID=89044 /ORGANISM="Spumella elongata, Strain CCAP 955/1" /LENGTH=343 /DNA_ID=CAMNT_0027508831 /DNA_START=66 /DNA_END=1097 /DNA_ORIENTATION=+
MSVIRKALGRGAMQLSKSGKIATLKTPIQRSFSSILETREMGEEARYIRTQEHQRQAEIRANIERILALEEGHAEKTELVQMLEKKEEDTSLIARLGLNDWKFALPIGLFVGIPALSNQVLVLDAETQLVACFILFCSTMYVNVGGMLGKSLDDYSREIYEELQAVDNTVLEQINTAIVADQQVLTIEEDFKAFNEITDSLAMAQADLLNQREAHLYREAIVKKLDSLSALEESAVFAIRNRMLTSVKAEVVDTFVNDKKVKEAALDRAIAVLAGGAKGKLGEDVVGKVFSQALSNYRTAYAKQPAGSDPILLQLEKDVAAVAQAPVVESKGGNVFVTHPLVL